MKKLLFPFLMLVSTISFAQVDTSKLSISIVLKQKVIGYMAQKLSQSNSLADLNYRDSLIKYDGSGNNPDSQITTHLSADMIFRLINNLFNETAGVSYSTIYEVGNGATGYSGLLSQLFTKAATVNAEQGVSKWIFVQIMNLLNSGQGVMGQKVYNGGVWLKNPISYN